jgi:hypothetical protein
LGEVKWHTSEVAGEGGNVYHTHNLQCPVRVESLFRDDDERIIAAWNTRASDWQEITPPAYPPHKRRCRVAANCGKCGESVWVEDGFEFVDDGDLCLSCLQAENAQLKAQLAALQWISVDERLPNDNEEILFDVPSCYGTEKGRFDGKKFVSDRTSPHNDQVDWEPAQVTAWMLCPEFTPPEPSGVQGKENAS